MIDKQIIVTELGGNQKNDEFKTGNILLTDTELREPCFFQDMENTPPNHVGWTYLWHKNWMEIDELTYFTIKLIGVIDISPFKFKTQSNFVFFYFQSTFRHIFQPDLRIRISHWMRIFHTWNKIACYENQIEFVMIKGLSGDTRKFKNGQ